MKNLKSNTLVLSAIVFFLTANCVYSYPPDNAAVLYYKAAVHYEVDDEMKHMLADFQKSKIELNDKIREFVKGQRLTIDIVLDAAEVKNCDWGMDMSQGLKEVMPHLSKMRGLSRLIAADAKILAQDKNYEAAFSRCMSLYRMARHINDRIFISYLVGVAVNGVANDCLTQILSNMPPDMQSLTSLKTQLIEIDSIPLSVKPALLGEREAILIFMTPEHMPDVVEFVEDKSVKEKLLSADEAFLERNREYFKNYYAGIIAAFDMPYVEGYAVLTELAKKKEKDAKNNPDAILIGFLAPTTQRIFTLSTRFKTHNNAIRTAIEPYLIKAQTGKLPDELPTGLSGDFFSNKPFNYEKTADGFILHCQGKSLDKDEIYEYEFKVKK